MSDPDRRIHVRKQVHYGHSARRNAHFDTSWVKPPGSCVLPVPHIVQRIFAIVSITSWSVDQDDGVQLLLCAYCIVSK